MKKTNTAGVIMIIFCIIIGVSIVNLINKPTKWESEDNNNTNKNNYKNTTTTTSTTKTTYSVSLVQGVNCDLLDTSTGVQWLGAINEYKRKYCSNYLASLKAMGRDTSKATPEEMMKCIDIFYDDKSLLFEPLSNAAYDYSKFFNLN